MTFWVLIAWLTLVAAGVVLLPLWRRWREEAARAAYDMEVYRDQLDEVARDLERGLLTEEQAATARTEIERRLLAAAAARRERTAEAGSGGRRARLALVVTAVVGPLAALGLYLELGEPGLPGQPFAYRTASRATGAPGVPAPGDVEAMVAQLAARLEAEPEDREGWLLLGRSYMFLKRFPEAAGAYARAFALDHADPAAASAYGEAVVFANDGSVIPEARAAFTAALASDPKEPRARFYLALAKLQEGRPREALEDWEALAADTPPDAPWLPGLERHISQLREELGDEP